MTSLLSGLINELAISIDLNGNHLIAILPNINDSNKDQIKISASAQRDVFTNEIELISFDDIRLNDQPFKSIDDLVHLGFNDDQLKLLKENQSATEYLEKIYDQCDKTQPQLLRTLENLLKISIENIDVNKPGALAELFSRLPQREAFILSDTCGNIDGSTGNPLKNVMIGPIERAIEYHPISVAFHQGYSQVHLIDIDPSKIRTMGVIPERLNQYQSGFLLLNDYTFRVMQQTYPTIQSKRIIDAFTLMSKRSLVPLEGDYQIKTSFPGQITSEVRTIDWIIASDVINSNVIAIELAKKGLLPDGYWILQTQYIAQLKHDDRTTFYLRDGLIDAMSNDYCQPGLPKHLTPITACALTSRNILTKDKTLLESLIEFGFDPWDLFSDISRTMISVQLNLIRLGWIPDSHTQNIVYLFDFEKKVFAGVLNRDVECEKLLLNRLRKLDIKLPDEKDINYRLLRILAAGDAKLLTIYLHHTVYTKHIVPLARILHQKYQFDSKKLIQHVQQCLSDWLKSNEDASIHELLDFSGRFYERNLACKTLNIGESPHFRLVDNYPLLPAKFVIH